MVLRLYTGIITNISAGQLLIVRGGGGGLEIKNKFIFPI